MKEIGTQDVGWEDSYLLGWKRSMEDLLLFVQVLLSDSHSGFKPFDEDTEHGSYRLGVLSFSSGVQCAGLPDHDWVPRWDNELAEFVDVAEIDSFDVDESGCRIDADELELQIRSAFVKLELLEEESEAVFSTEFRS
ncbi:MAG: hypothetical protein AAF219_08330 [Myxococcota bacterium]